MAVADNPGEGEATVGSAKVGVNERSYLVPGLELNGLVVFLTFQALGHAEMGLALLAASIASRALTSVSVTIGTDSSGAYYFTRRFWPSNRPAPRTAVPNARLTHWSSRLFCHGFELRGSTAALRVAVKGYRTSKPIVGLVATAGDRPPLSPSIGSLAINLPNIALVAGCLFAARNLVCWQTAVVALAGFTDILFSLGACLVGAPYVRRSPS